MKNTAIMKNWSIGSNQDGFKSPELVRLHLSGNIHDDSSERFNNGDYVSTGSIVEVVDCESHKIVSTGRADYTVYPDDVDPEYERQFPGAYKRLAVTE